MAALSLLWPIGIPLIKPVAYLFGNDFPGCYGVIFLPNLVWASWLLILLCRKVRVPLRVKTRLSTRGLAIMAVLLFLHLGAMDQIRELLMTSVEDVTDYETGLCIWYVCSLVLEIYFVLQLICSAPVQRWIQRKYVRIICLVFLGLAFSLFIAWNLLYPPKPMMIVWRVKEMIIWRVKEMMEVVFLAVMLLLQPWFVYFFLVVIRSIRNLIRRDKTWKEVFLFIEL